MVDNMRFRGTGIAVPPILSRILTGKLDNKLFPAAEVAFVVCILLEIVSPGAMQV
jgi:hypothetical protein